MTKRTPERAASATMADGNLRTGRGRGTPAHRSESEAAAVDVLAEHGYHGTSVRDIGERAGMSPAALYRWSGFMSCAA